MLPLTGTTNAQHMKEDLACDRFTLTAEELQAIETVAV
jgi:diketogulonate reductase-like aldo/keto reductase